MGKEGGVASLEKEKSVSTYYALVTIFVVEKTSRTTVQDSGKVIAYKGST